MNTSFPPPPAVPFRPSVSFATTQPSLCPRAINANKPLASMVINQANNEVPLSSASVINTSGSTLGYFPDQSREIRGFDPEKLLGTIPCSVGGPNFPQSHLLSSRVISPNFRNPQVVTSVSFGDKFDPGATAASCAGIIPKSVPTLIENTAIDNASSFMSNFDRSSQVKPICSMAGDDSCSVIRSSFKSCSPVKSAMRSSGSGSSTAQRSAVSFNVSLTEASSNFDNDKTNCESTSAL